MQSIVQTEYVHKTIIQSVICNTRFFVRILEVVRKLEDKAVDEHSLCKVEAASAKSASTGLMVQRTPPQLTTPSKIPSDSKFAEDPRCRRTPGLARSATIATRSWYRLSPSWYLTVNLTIVPTVGAVVAHNRLAWSATKIATCQKIRCKWLILSMHTARLLRFNAHFASRRGKSIT